MVEAAFNDTPRESAPAEAEGPPPAARWGVWESAATVLVFCVPAVVASGPPLAPEGGGWALLGSKGVPEGVLAAAAALVLTLAARGLKGTQAFLMVGVATCLTWFFVGCFGAGYGKGWGPYAALTGALLVAHYHTVPVTLSRAARRAEELVAARKPACLAAQRGIRRSVAGVAGSVAALDLGLLVAFVGDLVAPSERWLLVGLVWMMAAVASGGAFATLAAWKLPGRQSGSLVSRQGAGRPRHGVAKSAKHAEDAKAKKNPGELGGLGGLGVSVPAADPESDRGR